MTEWLTDDCFLAYGLRPTVRHTLVTLGLGGFLAYGLRPTVRRTQVTLGLGLLLFGPRSDIHRERLAQRGIWWAKYL